MKKLLLKRILPFMLAVIMLCSFCLPVGAFFISSPVDDEGNTYYTVELNNGILQVKLNPQKVYDVLSDGDLSEEELTKFIPEDIWNTLSGGTPSMDDLRALAAQYITPEDFEELLALLPQEIVTQYFMNVEFMEGLITLDEVLALVDVDALLADLGDPTWFECELNTLLTPVMDDLLTQNVRNELLANETFMKEILIDTIDTIMDERRDEVMAKLPDLVTADVINALLAEERYKNALADMIQNDQALIDEIKNDPDLSHKLALYLEDPVNRTNAEELLKDPAVIAELQAHPEWLLNEQVIAYMFQEGKLTGQKMHAIFGDTVINEMVAADDYAILDQLMTSDALISNVVASDAFEGMANAIMTDTLFKQLMTVPGFDLESYVTLDDAFAAQFGITPENLQTKGYVSSSDIQSAIVSGMLSATPTFAELVEKGFVNINGVFNDPDYNITVATLGLTNAELQTITADMVANPYAKQLIKDAFTAQVKAGNVSPAAFVDDIDFASIANDENNPIDLNGMVYALLSTDEDSATHLKQLFNEIQLSKDEYKEIFAKVGYAECVAMLDAHLDEILTDIGLAPILAHFPAMDLVDALFATPEKPGFLYLLTTETSDPDDAAGTMLVSYDEVLVALGKADKPTATLEEQRTSGISTLVALLDPAKVASELGSLILNYVSFSEIVASVGGYNTVLGWYVNDKETINKVIAEIGYQNLMGLLKGQSIHESDAFIQLGKDLFEKITSDQARLKEFIKSFKQPLLQIAMDEITNVSLNDTIFFENGRLNLQTALLTLLKAVPDVDTFLAMAEGDTFFGLKMKVVFRNGYAPLTLGVDVSFDGDFTKLQDLAEQHRDLFVFDVSDDMDISVSAVLPGKVADLAEKVLESSRISAALKGKLLTLSTGSIADAIALLKDLSDEELGELSDAVNENLDKVLAKADAVSEKLPGQVADRVDAILNKLRTPAGLRSVIGKLDSAVKKLPEKAQELAVTSLYKENGVFSFAPVAFDIDVADQIPQLSSLPAGLMNTAISGSVKASATFKGLYRLTLADSSGNTTVFFLPAGTDLSILEHVENLDLSVWGENLPATMPTADTRVDPPLKDNYELIFLLHKPGFTEPEEIDRIRYTEGDTSLEREPVTPAELRGYSFTMPDYLSLMNTAQSVTVDLYYTAIPYTVSFHKLGASEPVKVTYTVESDVTTMSFPALTAADAAYEYVWKNDTYAAWTPADLAELIANEAKALGDITLTETQQAKRYTITFKDATGAELGTTIYNVNGALQELVTLPVRPGYTNQWQIQDPATQQWSEWSFDANALCDQEVHEKKTPIEKTFTFQWFDDQKEDTIVTYTVETTFAQFKELAPEPTDGGAVWTYFWTLNNALWTEASFEAMAGNANKLQDFIIVEKRDSSENVHNITLNGLPGGAVDPISFHASMTWNDIKDSIVLPEENKAYTYKWQKDGVDWNGETDFDPEAGASFELNCVAVPKPYAIGVTKYDGEPASLPYNFDTGSAKFKDDLKELLPVTPGVDDPYRVYKWEIKDPDTGLWSDWDVDAFAATLFGTPAARMARSAGTDPDMNALGNYEIRAALREYTITFTRYEFATTSDATETILVKYNKDGLLSGYTLPEAHLTNAGYTYKWQKNGVDWTTGDFTVSEYASYEVVEVRTARPYTYTFVPLVGSSVIIDYTIETSPQDFANKFNTQAPALTAGDNKYTYEWQIDGATWEVTDFVGDDMDAIDNFTVRETYTPVKYYVTFTYPGTNQQDVRVEYTVETLPAQFQAQVPALSSDKAYTYRWVDEDGLDWTSSAFDANDLTDYVITQAKTLIQYTYSFYLYGNSVPVVVPYNYETLATAFQVPAHTIADPGYKFIWQLNNAEWTKDDFVAGNMEALNNYVVNEIKQAITYTITFDMQTGDDKYATYTVENNLSHLLAQIPAHTTADAAYAYDKWSRLSDGSAWDPNALTVLELADFTVVEGRTPKTYTYTFKPLAGDPIVVEYTIETALNDFKNRAPEVGSAVGYTYQWKKDGAAWNENMFQAGVLGALGNYEILETREAIIYTLTYEKFKADDNTVKVSDAKVIFTVQYTVEGPVSGQSWVAHHAENAFYTFKWQKNGVDWTPQDAMSAPGSYTVTEKRTAKIYTWTFVREDGSTIGSLNFDADKTPNSFTGRIGALLPKATGEEYGVYAFEWYKKDLSTDTVDLSSAWTNVASSFTAATLRNQTIVAMKRIHKYNTLTWTERDGSILTTYYYDREHVYNSFFAYPENIVTTAPTARNDYPGRYFESWILAKTNDEFSFDTFRDCVTQYGYSGASDLTVKSTYGVYTYTLTFTRQDGSIIREVDYNVDTLKSSMAPSSQDAPTRVPMLDASNAAYEYYWRSLSANTRWNFDTMFDPATALADMTIELVVRELEYDVAFQRANGSVVHLTLKISTEKDAFTAAIPDQGSSAAFTRRWLYNTTPCTNENLFDLLFGVNGIDVTELKDYTIVEEEIAHTFMLTFKDLDGNIITTVVYNGYGVIYGSIPTLPSTEYGYLYGWWNTAEDAAWAGFDPLEAKNLTLKQTRTPIRYSLTFQITGLPDQILYYTVEDHSFEVPTVAPRAGYSVNWFYMDGEVKYNWTKETLSVGDLVLTAEYVPLSYTVTFHGENDSKYVFSMTVESKSNPSTPPKPGYFGVWYVQLGSAPANSDPKWTDYQLTSGGQQVTAYVRYTPLPYQVIFMVDGELHLAKTYTLDGDWIAPEAPAKDGYTAQWFVQDGNKLVEWETFNLSNSGSSVTAELVYTPIQYTATFMADGNQVGTVTFTVEDKTLKAPAVPAKDGFQGEWEAYTIGAGDMTIQAVYTEIVDHPFGDNGFLIFIDSFVSGLYEKDENGLHWIWWLIIILLIILIILTLILILVILKKKKKVEPEPEPEPDPEPIPEPTPEPTPVVIPEPVDSVDVATADSMMEDAAAMAVLETIGGAKASGMKSIVNIGVINERFESGETVDLDALKAKKLIPAKAERIKILADGHLDKPLTVVADSFSLQAIKMITLTGGKAVQRKV